MSIPSTQKRWVVKGQKRQLEGFQLEEGPVPTLKSRDVLVKLHATTVNYREITILNNNYVFHLNLPVVGGSDRAGEVVQLGPEVTKWKVGDRVSTIFNFGHQAGPLSQKAFEQGSLGATIDGTYQEYGAFDEDWLVRLASHLSYLEGAVQSDAAVTAWNALYGSKPLRPGQTVLLQGTGGVSLFALQFAKAGGARVVATTSSPAKADLLKRLGADHVINYNEARDWGVAARRLTADNEGFDHILDIGGAGTLDQSFEAIKIEGVITIIGLVTGLDAKTNIMLVLGKICTLRGIHVGSKVLKEDMMVAMKLHNIHPVLDSRVFRFDELEDAIEHMKAAKHIGKIGITIP